MAENIKSEEIISDVELDNVSGGNAIQTAHDKNLFKLIGTKETNLVKNFAKYGVTFSENKGTDNQYFFNGTAVSQDFAHKAVRLQASGYTDIGISHFDNGQEGIGAKAPDGTSVIFNF